MQSFSFSFSFFICYLDLFRFWLVFKYVWLNSYKILFLYKIYARLKIHFWLIRSIDLTKDFLKFDKIILIDDWLILTIYHPV